MLDCDWWRADGLAKVEGYGEGVIKTYRYVRGQQVA